MACNEPHVNGRSIGLFEGEREYICIYGRDLLHVEHGNDHDEHNINRWLDHLQKRRSCCRQQQCLGGTRQIHQH